MQDYILLTDSSCDLPDELAHEMELEVRFQEALGAAMIRVTFDETNLKLSVRSQMPEELDITKRNVTTLTGSLESI